MANTKYEKQYSEMMENNQEVFDLMKTLSTKPKSPEFKEVQLKVLRIARKTEDKLCSKMENTRNSSFSTGLADKFWEKIRAEYPEIDISVEDC